LAGIYVFPVFVGYIVLNLLMQHQVMAY